MNLLKKALIGTSFGAMVAVIGSGAAVAAPIFTVDPTSINGTGASFDATDFNFTSVATVTQNADNTQTEVGYARLNSMGLDGAEIDSLISQIAAPSSYHTAGTYGLYFTFTATVSGVSNFQSAALGTVTQFDFTLYADAGRDTVFTPGTCTNVCTDPTETTGGDIALASGHLISGSAGFQGSTNAPTLAALTTFDLTAAGMDYFVAPNPFYQFALTSTTANSGSVVKAGTDGTTITINGINGGANLVPEPLTLSVFGAGLFGAAALRRRRKAKKA
jgi:hypothetical protein